MSSQVLIIIVIAYGALLNLLAKPWSSTDSMLERRRNDLVAILLWLILLSIAAETVRAGIASRGTPDAFDLQDWTALVLPFALAAPYLLELSATLIRQLEMWQWMRRATIQALPIAWMYRTMTVGEDDADGAWLRSRQWAPWEHRPGELNVLKSSCSFWRCTSREATLFHLFRRWMTVLLSALRYATRKVRKSFVRRAPFRCLEYCFLTVLVLVLTTFTGALVVASILEVMLLLLFDYAWWRQCALSGVIVSRYDVVHFGRDEMQNIFEHSIEIRASLREVDGVDISAVHNRIMGAVFTTTAVLENAFRKAYLATPVYELSISNRKALREKYGYVGCDLDRLIKQVRILLERQHTAGLMSITSTSGTIEAALHNNIESILSVAIFFEPLQLYNIVSRIAHYEWLVEQRLHLQGVTKTPGESMTRERVVYIDARNAAFWLLWTVVTQEWRAAQTVWCSEARDKGTGQRTRGGTASGETTNVDKTLDGTVDEEAGVGDEFVENGIFGERWIDALYVVATFLSRCRYCGRYGIGANSEAGFFVEARSLCKTAVQRADALEAFYNLSDALMAARGIDLLGWTEREYGLEWVKKGRVDGARDGWLRCAWTDDTGAKREEDCSITFEQ